MKTLLGIVIAFAGLALMTYVVGTLSTDAVALLMGLVLGMCSALPFMIGLVAGRRSAPTPTLPPVEPRQLSGPQVVEQHLHLHGVEPKQIEEATRGYLE